MVCFGLLTNPSCKNHDFGVLYDNVLFVRCEFYHGNFIVTATEVSSGTIIIAEDNAPILNLNRRILEGFGYDVLTAINGLEAWYILQGQTVDLAIVDIDMPTMNGFELIERIRNSEVHHDLPILVLTTDITPDSRQICVDLGVDLYVVKPISTDDLIATVQELLQGV